MRWLVLSFQLLILASCASKAPILVTQNQKDTVWISQTQTLRDTVVVTPAASAVAKQTLESLKKRPIQVKNKQAGLKVFYKNDTIYAEARCDSLEKRIQLKDKEIMRLQKSHQQSVVQMPLSHHFFSKEMFVLICIAIVLWLIVKINKSL